MEKVIERQVAQIGDEVIVRTKGTVIAIEERDGDIRYTIENKRKGIWGNEVKVFTDSATIETL